jgi:disulfide bond formation protein DsbB
MGSLYFSEVLSFIPCKLCWFQRILMYPLVFILFFQTTRKEYNLQPALIFSVLGVLLSAYHYMLQAEWIGNVATACSTISCGIRYINYLGFVTIPLLSFTGFSLVSIFLLLSKKKYPKKIFSKR